MDILWSKQMSWSIVISGRGELTAISKQFGPFPLTNYGSFARDSVEVRRSTSTNYMKVTNIKPSIGSYFISSDPKIPSVSCKFVMSSFDKENEVRVTSRRAMY